MSGLLSTAISGLRVSQNALNTTGHNIANANTDGFSRQRIETSTNNPSVNGAGFIGNGVKTDNIVRIIDEFVIEQLRIDTSLNGELSAFNENVRQLNTLLSNSNTGLSQSLDSFFAALQNGADDPTSIPARQLFISESENLATRFNTLYERFDSINKGVNENLEVSINQINSLTTNIAELNVSISAALGFSDSPPNDLLDKRDEALRKLSELVSIQTYDQGQGQVNVLVGGGQSLVVGSVARQLTLIDGELNASAKDISFADEVGSQIITSFISGGQVGGLLDFRESSLDNSFNELGRLALVMADTFNQAHRQGLDLNGLFGGQFFNDINATAAVSSRAFGANTNAQPNDGVINVFIDDSSQLTNSDYEVRISATNSRYSITRVSDDTEVAAGVLPNVLPVNVQFDGLDVSFASGTFNGSDRYLIQPTRTAARDIETNIFRPEELAFASPLSTEISLSNTGNGAVSPGELLGLVDINGNALPMFATTGAMSPPLLIRFTTPTTYEILDNTDPGNPVALSPPIRNQSFIPGITTDLFTEDMGETLITAVGASLGLPNASTPILQANMQPAPSVAPNFLVTDFSGTGDQFAFDVVVAGTGTAFDGTTTVTINSAGITDEATLLADINDELTAANRGVTAYMNNGQLAFRLDSPGFGDITVNNYDADPDLGTDNAPVGQANNLFGFDIEGTVFTTVANADGTSGDGALVNGYPSELITFTTTDPVTGAISTTNITTTADDSANGIANALSAVPGVSAIARNYVEISALNVTRNEPLQVTLNGQDLLVYDFNVATSALELEGIIPDPATDPGGFNDYLANQINNNATLQGQNIYAVSATDSISGIRELRIYSTSGDDINIELTAAAGESVDINDGINNDMSLTGMGVGVTSGAVIGGRLDVTLASDITMNTNPIISGLFGDSSAAGFAQLTYLGIQASLSGVPDTGDTFTVDFNTDGVTDNRNALVMGDLSLEKLVDGNRTTYSDSYGALIELIGIKTNSSEINLQASDQILTQTTELRNSVSAVNLDEEAANLIQFEQIYNANAQVISVAQDLFDRLISIF